MKRAISFVLVLSLGLISFSQNLVVNPGFETWESTTKPTGWIKYQNCIREEVTILTGIYSCRQETTTDSKDLEQKILISSEKHYTIAFYYKTGSSTTGNGSRVWCEWLDQKQAPISESVLHSAYMKSETWQQYTADLTPPEGAVYFHLIVRSLPNSVTYWDDFVFEESVPTNSPEEKNSNVSIYPNPVKEYLNISNAQHLQHIEILSLTGTLKYAFDYFDENPVIIPVSSLSKGVYIISIRTLNKNYIRKFIKD